MDSLDRNKRRSVLNNPFLADAVKHNIVVNFTQFQGELLLTTGQVADFYGVDDRTIRRLIEDNREEIENSGYRNLREDELKDFRNYVKDKNVLNIKSPVISVFTFRAFLNAGMLLKGSEKARQLRQLLLDTTISLIQQKAGGDTKYINQRDENFLPASFNNEQYNEKLKYALKEYVDMGAGKFPKVNNLVYKTVFNESAQK